MIGIGTDIQAISEFAALANICPQASDGGKHVVHGGDAGSEEVAVRVVGRESSARRRIDFSQWGLRNGRSPDL